MPNVLCHISLGSTCTWRIVSAGVERVFSGQNKAKSTRTEMPGILGMLPSGTLQPGDGARHWQVAPASQEVAPARRRWRPPPWLCQISSATSPICSITLPSIHDSWNQVVLTWTGQGDHTGILLILHLQMAWLARGKCYSDLGNCLQKQAGAVESKDSCIEWHPPLFTWRPSLGSGACHSTLVPATPQSSRSAPVTSNL